MTPPPCPRPGCPHTRVTTRDALGRPRERRVCDGIAEPSIHAPTRDLTTRPEHRPAETMAPPVSPFLLPDVFAPPASPAPDGVLDPLTALLKRGAALEARRADRAGRTCRACAGPVPLDALSPVCDGCCAPSTLRERQRTRAREVEDEMARRTLVRRSGGAA